MTRNYTKNHKLTNLYRWISNHIRKISADISYEYPYEYACDIAIENDDIECLIYLREQGYPWGKLKCPWCVFQYDGYYHECPICNNESDISRMDILLDA